MKRAEAISRLVIPDATRRRISLSRGLSSAEVAGGLEGACEPAVALPDQGEVGGENLENVAVAVAERPSLTVEHQEAGAGLAGGEEQLHDVVDPEWSADLCVQVKFAELTEAEDVGEAARDPEGSNPPSYALRPRGKRILIDHVVVQPPYRIDVSAVGAVHDPPVAGRGAPLLGGGDRARDQSSQRRQHVP